MANIAYCNLEERSIPRIVAKVKEYLCQDDAKNDAGNSKSDKHSSESAVHGKGIAMLR